MAQNEDTELRDLVIEALEKNGSLAKIRALLRANIFLAFEDECENIKQNEALDNILLLPEGKLCLSIIHDFLDFCNLRNTLFVYKSETRQSKEYMYEGRNMIADKLNIKQSETGKEPILLSIINNVLNPNRKKVLNQNDKHANMKRMNRNKSVHKSDQNCKYAHEDSSTTTSHSQSDISSDEKNKLDLRLTLDNSDTDTSSESRRSKTRSEYIPSKHKPDCEISEQNILVAKKGHQPPNQFVEKHNSLNYTEQKSTSDHYANNLKMFNSSSTESTSYVDLKPFNPIDAVLLNTTGLPLEENKENRHTSQQKSNTISKVDTLSQVQTLSSNSESIKKDSSHHNSKSLKNSPGGSTKYDEITEYSYDFSSPPVSGRKISDKQSPSPKSLHEDYVNKSKNNSPAESNKNNSLGSHSSVSLSDVADLISEKSSNRLSNNSLNQLKLSLSDKSNRSPNRELVKMMSDDSGDFSESPIPSLSNLSLDIHSD